MTEQPDDTALMSRYREGETAAFEELYARHRGPLYRFLLHQCRPRDDAADVFQEVWSRVIRGRERYTARASFRTYLYHIAHTCLIDHHRRRGRRALDGASALEDAELVTPAHEQPEAQAAQAQMEDAFRRALAGLPEEQLSVFLLFEEGGLALKEIAEVTGAPVETVKSRLRYALARLRRGLAPDFEMGRFNPASVQT